MTPSEALDAAITASHARFRYLADAPTLDAWDTVAEMDARGGGDCDGWSLWCLAHAAARVPAPGAYWFVVGTVVRDGETLGHAWVEIRDGADRQWADPTWGMACRGVAWYSDRVPQRAYPMDGELLGLPVDYEEVRG
jgi:hypothetical protein